MLWNFKKELHLFMNTISRYIAIGPYDFKGT